MSLRTPTEPGNDFTLPTKNPSPQPQKQEVWRKTETPGVEVNQDGKLRTNIPARSYP